MCTGIYKCPSLSNSGFGAELIVKSNLPVSEHGFPKLSNF